VEFESQVPGAEVLFFVEDELFCVLEIDQWFLSEPAKRRVGLWYEPAYGDIYLGGFVVDFFSQKRQIAGEADDLFYFVFGFAGEACHKVEFYLLPSCVVGGFDGGEEVGVFEGFVDNISKPFGGGFDGDGEARFSDGGDELGEEF